MLLNPFTPSEIASEPNDFFGRIEELQILERSIAKGSVAIHGTIGIGKSSLLSRISLLMEGFGTQHKSKVVIAVGNKDIETVDDAARLILEGFVRIDESTNKVGINLGKVLTWESKEICRFFKEGRHLATLQRILENEYIEQPELLILAIDEADKCPIPLARLVRSITTHVQHQGINNIRFLFAGVNPYYHSMVEEDEGVQRFFYKRLSVAPLLEEEATELLYDKFRKTEKHATSHDIKLEVDYGTLDRVVQLSGGHPHVLQLLGSHLIEHEEQDPDGIIDSRDLVNTLRTVCYEDRDFAYTSLIHSLDIDGLLNPLKQLYIAASSTLPTKVDRKKALNIIEPETLKQFVASDILCISSANEYRVSDEFLRIRIVMDEEQRDAEVVENRLINSGSLEDESEDWPSDKIENEDEFE